ncbi:MAG: PQQ-binding-like beta-propeller repeat protein [Planctomycetes bacterium]|nr:PQQ-binding-like beta-propeller repeat protein [Planctomycetota bacterium]
MHSRRLIVAVIALATVVASAERVTAEWGWFRGPNHDGISADKGFQKEWKEPIPLMWEAKVGSAFSSFAVVSDRVFTCGTSEGQQTLYCLDAKTGKVIWKNEFEVEFRDSFGNGTRATPTVAWGKVYIQGAKGRLLCVDAETGKDVWSKKFSEAPMWGYSGSVLVEGDLAIASAGNAQGALVAFDRMTGEKRWQAGDDPVGYSTPYPFTFEGKRYVAGFTGKSAIVVEFATGRQVLRIPWKTNFQVNVAAPIYDDGHLFLTSGYQTGCALFKLTSEGDKLSAKQVWKSKVLMNKFQSCILHDGYLYSCDQKALVCVEFLTGEEKWRIRRVKHGTLVLADGHILLLTQSGQLKIAPVSTNGFDALTEAEVLSGKCWTVSVIDNGKLYARNMKRVVCLDLSGAGATPKTPK